MARFGQISVVLWLSVKLAVDKGDSECPCVELDVADGRRESFILLFSAEKIVLL